MAATRIGEVAAGFIIFRRYSGNIQYLLMQTSYGRHHWTPPKGHIEEGEDELTTAIRETSEEAGLESDCYKILDGFRQTLHYEVKGKMKRVEYWLAELNDPECPVRMSDEHQDYKWLNYEDALEVSGFKDMQNALTKAHEYILKNS